MNAVFIHIPRTAGRYIVRALGLRNFIYFRRMRDLFNQSGMITIGHQDYTRLLKKGIIGKKFDKTAFKFTFCRNPFSRVVSHYHHSRRKHPDILPRNVSIEYFIKNLEKYNIPRKLRYKVIQKRTFRPQVNSIRGVKMDFVGRFETLHEDIKKVADRLNIKTNKDVEKIGATRHKPYREYYNEELEQKIRAFYKKDFDAFSYNNNLLH